MFAQAQRLQTTKDILFCLRQGVRSRTGVIQCSFVAKAGTLERVTVIVDKKVSKKAVVRNLCKRRARAALRQLGLPAGDLVVRLFPGAEKLEFAELSAQLGQCLSKLH